MRPGENAFSLGSSCFFCHFCFYRFRNFSDMADVSCNAHTKKKTGNTEAAVQPVFIVCAARAGYVCPEDQQNSPLAASVGCKRKSCRQRIFLVFSRHITRYAPTLGRVPSYRSQPRAIASSMTYPRLSFGFSRNISRAVCASVCSFSATSAP